MGRPSIASRKTSRLHPPVYLATAAVYAALVAAGFFVPSPGEGSPFPDTPHLLVAAFALAVASAKLFRLATLSSALSSGGVNRDDDPRAITRRDGLEAGFLLILLVEILLQATGGPSSRLLPAQYLAVALLAANTDLASSLAFALLASALAVAPAFASGELSTVWRMLAAHAASLFAFAVGVGTFLRWERGARTTAQMRLARLQGDADALADATEDVDDLAAAGALDARGREKRLRELKNELDAGIHRTLALARASLGAHTVLYLRHDLDAGTLSVVDVATDCDEIVEALLDARQGVFAGAIKSRQAVMLGDVRGAPVSYYRKDVGVRSVLVVPLQHGLGGAAPWVGGLLVADHLEADRLGRKHADVLAGMAAMIADLEHGGRERERHAKFQDRLKHLVEVSRTLQDTLSPEELAMRALSASRSIADFDFALVAVGGAQGERLTISTAMGVDHGRLLGKDAPTSETLVGWVLRNRVYLKAEHFRSRGVKTPLLGKRLDPDGVRAALVFPMLREKSGEVVGAFVFGSLTRDAFTHDEFEMLELVSHQASMAMSNAVLYRRMEELATTDGLTGLNNHRYFQETLQREVERAQRNTATKFAVVIADIDHFKKVNDGYGHPMGDGVLRRVGKILKSTIQRKTDLVARYGGEEFVLVLADTNADGARQVIDRIRAAVGKEEFNADGRKFRITMSAGVVAYPDDVGLQTSTPAAMVKQALVERADRALYHSKESGRNRSTMWSQIAAAEAAAAAPALHARS